METYEISSQEARAKAVRYALDAEDLIKNNELQRANIFNDLAQTWTMIADSLHEVLH